MTQQLSHEKSIFLKAIDFTSAEQRAAYLDSACGSDGRLREQIEALLQEHAQPQGLLDSPEVAGTVDLPEHREPVGAHIGRYKLREQIGDGGFGVVYVAEQEKPVRRKVALKVIKPGMDTREVIARFESERQALALMDHPNVAKVLDAGSTDSGRPYFVMELVRGIRITEFCDKQKLGTRQRLQLFVDVCRAVQHAHQKGIIHRDLKPSNVMVTLHDGRPVPKVIDFGVSKAISQRLSEHTVYTAYGQMIGTPMYMSPEQAEFSGLDVDTRTDIYALGVLLYELLTGTTPFDEETLKQAGYDEMRRMIREDEPPRPSTRLSTLHAEALSTIADQRTSDPRKLSQSLRGDLDWIVMKSLEKDRNRRYESASALAADVERYLGDEPIEAKRPTLLDRAEKWSRRHKSVVYSAALLLVVATVASTVSTLLISRAYRGEAWERANAERERDTAKAALAREAAAQKREAAAKRTAQRRLVQSYVQRGRTLCERGEVDRGLLWLARSLEEIGPGADDLDHAVRASLAAWQPYLLGRRPVAQHNGFVQDVAFSPNGETLLTGSVDGTARLWDVATGEPLGPPMQQQGGVWAVAYSPDGKTLLTGSAGGAVQLWDTVTGQRLRPPMMHDAQVRAVAFSPDGKALLTGAVDHSARLWDAATGEPIGPPMEHAGNVFAVAFSPDGKTFLTGSSGHNTAQLWDTATRTPVGPSMRHDEHLYDLAFSPDGKTIMTGSHDTTARLWNADTGRPIGRLMQHEDYVRGVAFSPDGTTVLTGSADGTARLWDSATGKPVSSPVQHRSLGDCVGFSPDGKHIVVDRLGGSANSKTVWLYEVASLKPATRELRHGSTVHAGDFSPDGESIVTGSSDGTARLWDAATGEPIGPLLDHSSAVHAVAFSPDGNSVLTGSADNKAQLWDAATGLPVGPPLKTHGAVDAAVFSPDGRIILTSDQDGVAQLWDRDTARPISEPLRHPAIVAEATFSPDGKYVFTACEDGLVRLWDVASAEQVRQPIDHRAAVYGLAISRDGKTLFTGGVDATCRRWKTATGEPAGFAVKHKLIIYEVAISPDGKTLLTASGDSTARLWDAATGEPIGPPLQHQGAVKVVAFSPDGTMFLTGSEDGTARLWNVPVPVESAHQRITLWVQVMTGTELDDDGDLWSLDAQTWRERRRRLQELGGTPATVSQ